MRQNNEAFEGSIPGGRISKSKSAASRNNMTSVKKPAAGISGTRYPSTQSTHNRIAAGSNTSVSSILWPRMARVFLFAAFVVMGITLTALAIQIVKSVAAKHQAVEYLNTPEEQKSQDANQTKSTEPKTAPPMVPLWPGTPENTDTLQK